MASSHNKNLFLGDCYEKVDFAIFSPMPEELEHLFKEFSKFPTKTIKVGIKHLISRQQLIILIIID